MQKYPYGWQLRNSPWLTARLTRRATLESPKGLIWYLNSGDRVQ